MKNKNTEKVEEFLEIFDILVAKGKIGLFEPIEEIERTIKREMRNENGK